MANLIKIDRNGSKHFEGYQTCDRCGGRGGSEIWKFTDYTCWKCGGTGKVWKKWIERTPEYEAKLAERRAKKIAARLEEDRARHEEYLKAEALRKEQEEREAKAEAARKAISQYKGTEGEKIAFKGTYDHSAWYEAQAFGGFGKELRFIHTFKDSDGNVFVWKTGRGLDDSRKGEPIEITGIVKDHSEYDGEKQTILKNCKIKFVA